MILYGCGGDESYLSDAALDAEYACYMQEVGEADLSMYSNEGFVASNLLKLRCCIFIVH